MDFVHGFFYSFCRGSHALPMLSFFTYVVHAVSENHFKLEPGQLPFSPFPILRGVLCGIGCYACDGYGLAG